MTLVSRRRIWAPALMTVTCLAALPAKAEEFDPRTPTGAYLAGIHAQAENDLAAASLFLTEALAASPGDLELMRRTFTLAIAGGRIGEAAGLTETLAKADPGDQLARVTLALRDAKAGEWAAALARLDTAETGGIAKVVTPLLSAWLHAGAGDSQAAQADIEKLGSTEGFGPVAAIHRAMLLDYAGDLQNARVAYESLGEAGHTVRITEALGALYQRLGERDRARALYEAFGRANADNPLLEPALDRLTKREPAEPFVASPADGLAEGLFYIANLISQDPTNDGGDVALIYVRFALYLKPDFPIAQLLLGDILDGQGQYENALAAYSALPADTAAGWMGRLRATRSLEGLERFDEAIALAIELAAERPDRSDVYARLGDLYRGTEDFAAAIDAYDEAARREPKLAEIDWTFLYRRGIALERGDRFERGEADLRRAVALKPDHAHLLNYLGYSLLDRGVALSEAEELIRKAVGLAPDDGYIVDSLGWLYFRTGQIDEAAETLERAVTLNPEDATINDHLGDAYWMQGRHSEARFQWQRALRNSDEAGLTLSIEGKLAHGLGESAMIGESVTQSAAPVD